MRRSRKSRKTAGAEETEEGISSPATEVYRCPYCREPIKRDALKCKHCHTTLIDTGLNGTARTGNREGSLWLSIVSAIMGSISLLALLDDSGWDMDTISGVLIFALIGMIAGIVSLNTRQAGRGVAIYGVITSVLAGLALVGVLAEMI